MANNTLMQLNRVTKTYHMGEVTVSALKETTLEVYQGEILVILGPSGSGKSTLLNIMGEWTFPPVARCFLESIILDKPVTIS